MLVLLGAKLACCVLLTLAVAGVLGDLGTWLFETNGVWVLAGAVLALIVWAVPARRWRGRQKQD